MTEDDNARNAHRRRVLRPVKILINDSTLDCLIIDESEKGIRVRAQTPVPFPERVIIELRNGERWNAVTRWQKGVETGFEYESFYGLNEQAGQEAKSFCRWLTQLDVHALIARLEARNFFGNADLKTAAAAAGQSVKTLERVLSRLSERV